MINGNGKQEDFDERYTHRTLQEVLMWYDRLPSRLRELYDQFPEPVDSKDFYECFRALGEAGAYEYLYQMGKEIWPGWDLINRRKK